MEVLNNPQRQTGIREVIQILHEERFRQMLTLLSSANSRYPTRGDAPALTQFGMGNITQL
jgi:hypothetical protein